MSWRFRISTCLILSPLLALGVGSTVVIRCVTIYVPITWQGVIKRGLVNWGVPTRWVGRLGGTVLPDLPVWAILAAITFVLGLIRWRPAHIVAWVLSISLPVADLLITYAIDDDWLWFGTSLWLIRSVGAVVGLIAWYAGWRFRGRAYKSAKTCPLWVMRCHRAVLTGLFVTSGICGWWLFRALCQYSHGAR